MTWTTHLLARLDDSRLARLGAALWSHTGRRIALTDLSWAMGLFGPDGDRLVLSALKSGGAIDKHGVLRAPLLARWLLHLCGAGPVPRLVWTLPAQHPMAGQLGGSYTEAIIRVIESATSTVLMTSPFMHEHGIFSLLKVLVDALARGVRLTVLTHHAEDLASSQSVAVEQLRREAIRLGGALRVFTADAPLGGILHAKLVIGDEHVMLLGSANLTAPGMERNIEAGVVLSEGEAVEAGLVISELKTAGLIRLVYDTGADSPT